MTRPSVASGHPPGAGSQVRGRLVSGRSYFRDGWNVFDFTIVDFTIVALAWLPSSGPFAVLRALRVLPVLRPVSVLPQLRAVVGALTTAPPAGYRPER